MIIVPAVTNMYIHIARLRDTVQNPTDMPTYNKSH